MNPLPTSGAQLSEKRRRRMTLMRQRDDLAGTVLDRIRPRTELGPPRLSFAQQRMWFLNQMVPGSPFYNVPAATRIKAPVDGTVLRATFNEIIRRHEALRTAF